jgi:hypothetical protein
MTSRHDLCEHVCDALLDPAAPRPPGMDEHVATCASCRRLRDAHRVAERLAPPPARNAPGIGMDQVLAQVRRRRRGRAAMGTAAAVGIALVIALRVTTSPPRRVAGEDLFALADSVRGYAQREVASDDPALLAYAALAAWLAPPALHSLELPSLSVAPSPGIGATAGGISP